MRSARAAIVADRYPDFVRRFFGDLYGSDRTKFPEWAVTALRQVNVDLLAD
jgi:queuine tRNA-ribosyltransferase